MKTKIALLITTLLLPQSSFAGPFADEMSRCLVKSTSAADRELLIKWIFAAMASHPNVKQMSTVSSSDGEQLNKDTADLMVELLSVRCKKETMEAYRYEGDAIFKTSFGVLGKVAMQGIMADPNVSTYIAGLGNHLDTEKLEDIFNIKPKR